MAASASGHDSPPRDLSYWIGKGYSDNLTRSAPPAPELAVTIAREILDDAISIVQSIRVARGPNILAGPYFSRLFTRYVVDPKSWWGPSNEIPPPRAGILEIPLPPGAEPIRDALRGLHDILEGPFAISRLTTSHPDCPTQAERKSAGHFLIESLSKLESLTIGLKTALANFDAESEQRPTASKEVLVKMPSADQIRVFYLSKMIGKTQAEVAALYTEGTGIPMTQGQVSRAIADVNEWVAAGNKLPEFQMPPPRSVQSVDPNVLDLGANREGRTKRQRGKSDEN
jgi:hypothetical protein